MRCIDGLTCPKNPATAPLVLGVVQEEFPGHQETDLGTFGTFASVSRNPSLLELITALWPARAGCVKPGSLQRRVILGR